MKSAVQLRRTDKSATVQLRLTHKSATVQLRQTHRLTRRISDIYIIDGISHQTDSKQFNHTEQKDHQSFHYSNQCITSFRVLRRECGPMSMATGRMWNTSCHWELVRRRDSLKPPLTGSPQRVNCMFVRSPPSGYLQSIQEPQVAQSPLLFTSESN